MRSIRVVIVACACVAMSLSGAAGAASSKYKATITVKKNKLTAIAAAAEKKAEEGCAKSDSYKKAVINVLHKGARLRYDYTCAEVSPTATTSGGGATSSTGSTIGSSIETANGNATVHAYEQPVEPVNTFIGPDDGHEYASIDVEACSTATATLSFNPYQFSLEMPDHTRLQPTYGGREPVLNLTPLATGDCVRGWITYAPPAGQRAASVILEAGGFNPKLYRWTV